jgi:hypothetical protein
MTELAMFGKGKRLYVKKNDAKEKARGSLKTIA